MLLQKRVQMLLLLDEMWHPVRSDDWVLLVLMQKGAGGGVTPVSRQAQIIVVVPSEHL